MISKQSTSNTTHEKPQSIAKITPARIAIASAIKGSVTPGYGLLHALMKPEGVLAMPLLPHPCIKEMPTSVLIFTQSDSGGL
jgi:hypothetical protein